MVKKVTIIIENDDGTNEVLISPLPYTYPVNPIPYVPPINPYFPPFYPIPNIPNWTTNSTSTQVPCAIKEFFKNNPTVTSCLISCSCPLCSPQC
jgi:hypothetical protein